MAKATKFERVTKILTVKYVERGGYFRGKLHDNIEMEDRDGNLYIYAAIVKNIKTGTLGAIAEELELSEGKQFTLSFVPLPDKEDSKVTWLWKPRLLKNRKE